jgi:farnesyl diphosphate synthase
MTTTNNTFFFKDMIENYDTYLNNYLKQLNFPDPLLQKAVNYVLLTPSKKIRAKLVYATGYIYQLPLSVLNPIALAIEMIHAYTLVHDDLPAMDNDDWRRGKPSCHKAYDEATAILTGNTLFHLACTLLLDTLPAEISHAQSLAIVQTILNYIGPNGLLSGQNLDLKLLSQKKLSLETLTHIHHLKTTALLQAIVETVWLAASGSSKDKQILNQFIEHLGLAYQMLDDYGDAYATEQWGKNKSSDELNEKNTFVKFYTQEELKQKIINELNLAQNMLYHLPNHLFLNDLVIDISSRIKNL